MKFVPVVKEIEGITFAAKYHFKIKQHNRLIAVNRREESSKQQLTADRKKNYKKVVIVENRTKEVTTGEN